MNNGNDTEGNPAAHAFQAADRIDQAETKLQEIQDIAGGLASSDLDALGTKNGIEGLRRLIAPVLDDLAAATGDLARVRAEMN